MAHEIFNDNSYTDTTILMKSPGVTDNIMVEILGLTEINTEGTATMNMSAHGGAKENNIKASDKGGDDTT